jgi:hypothetical protein
LVAGNEISTDCNSGDEYFFTDLNRATAKFQYMILIDTTDREKPWTILEGAELCKDLL